MRPLATRELFRVHEATVREEVRLALLPHWVQIGELLEEGASVQLVEQAFGQVLVDGLQVVAARLLGQPEVLLQRARDVRVDRARGLVRVQAQLGRLTAVDWNHSRAGLILREGCGRVVREAR